MKTSKKRKSQIHFNQKDTFMDWPLVKPHYFPGLIALLNYPVS